MLCCRLLTDSNGDDLCSGGTDIHFTNYTWPTGVKSDRGLNITFTKDIILPPGGFLGGKGSNGQANIALSFKDDTNHYRSAEVLNASSTLLLTSVLHLLMDAIWTVLCDTII